MKIFIIYYPNNAIDSVKKKKVKTIYFLNKKRKLEYSGNFLKNNIVIINFETYFEILSEQKGIAYFDAIDTSSTFIKVKRNKLYGYYNITPIIYSELAAFEFNLAKFKRTNANGTVLEGYIDILGNSYYK